MSETEAGCCGTCNAEGDAQWYYTNSIDYSIQFLQDRFAFEGGNIDAGSRVWMIHV